MTIAVRLKGNLLQPGEGEAVLIDRLRATGACVRKMSEFF
jgi:hypothetical protein